MKPDPSPGEYSETSFSHAQKSNLREWKWPDKKASGGVVVGGLDGCGGVEHLCPGFQAAGREGEDPCVVFRT